jgi:serine protease Do
MNRKQVYFLIIIVALATVSCSGFTSLARVLENDEQTNIEAVTAPVEKIPPVDLPIDVESLDTLQGAFVDVYEKVSPSVVNIQVVVSGADLTHPEIPGFPEFELPEEMPSEGLGSGFVWDKAGYIVTNNHVVADAERITVTFSDGYSVDAELVGNDPASDLAVVKVDVPADRLIPVDLADSTKLKVGYLVIAIGNPFGLQGTMTTGVVSALGRSLPIESQGFLEGTFTIPDIIQTDAPINPGNSGGVLVDIQGAVVGVTTAIESPVRGNTGIGYVVPSVIVQKVVPALIEDGRYEHAWLGLSGTTLTSELAGKMDLEADQRGALVISIIADSPAEKAGLLGSDQTVEINGQKRLVGGDVLISIDAVPINDFEDLVAYLANSTEVGQKVELTILRKGEEKNLKAELSARPAPEPVQEIAELIPENDGGWLGILGFTLSPEISTKMDLEDDQFGVLVQEVISGGPADDAGLRSGREIIDVDGYDVKIGGDIIVALQGRPITSMTDLKTRLQSYEVGSDVDLTVLRKGKEVKVTVTLGARPIQ